MYKVLGGKGGRLNNSAGTLVKLTYMSNVKAALLSDSAERYLKINQSFHVLIKKFP